MTDVQRSRDGEEPPPSNSLPERAMRSTRMSVTITDPTLPDNPLIWVNPAFTQTTGYTAEESIGRNCRFLQGPDTEAQPVDQIHTALLTEQPVTTTLLNYRKDGSAFWNEVAIAPVRDRHGKVTHFVGVQADVTARVQAQRARDQALAQVAVAADRLALLADFTAQMALSQRPELIIELLAKVLVPRIGTWCAVYTFGDAGRLAPPYLRHEREHEPAVAARLARLGELAPDELPEMGPIWRALRGERRDLLIADVSASGIPGSDDDGGVRSVLRRGLGLRSLIVAALPARRGILGCVAVATDDSRPPLSTDELSLARDLAVRAGLMLENNLLYERERATAATLQRSLLPRLPEIDGIDVAAAYVPAADEAAVGGDWYDVFALRPDENPQSGRGTGSVGVVVGDVMGHNYDSAARMGKLSTVVRSYAWPGADPGAVFTAVDDLLAGTDLDLIATCLYARLTLNGSGGGGVLAYASAGHPPAIVRMPSGAATTLDAGRGVMVGVRRLLRSGRRRDFDTAELPSGSTLLCFTDGLLDGLTEEPDYDLALAELVRLTGELPVDASPQLIVTALTAAVRRHVDDVALVAIRVR